MRQFPLPPPSRNVFCSADNRSNSSYEILSDPQKRGIYDQYGEEGLSGDGGMGGGMSAEDLFSQFFGGMGGGMGGMFGGGMQQQGPKRVRTLLPHMSPTITLA